MYLRRHCYNKPHRCSGWAGGGWRGTYDDRKPPRWDEVHNEDGSYPWETSNSRRRHWWQARDRCDNGYIWTRARRDPWMNFRFGRCYKCDIRTIPLWTRWLDPTYLWFKLTFHPFSNLRFWVEQDGVFRGTWKAIRSDLWTKWDDVTRWWEDLVYWYSPKHREEKTAETAALRTHYGIE